LTIAIECGDGHAVQFHDVGKIAQPANVPLHLAAVEGAISDDADPHRQEMFECAVFRSDAACGDDGRRTARVREPET
jgi:hypothetical protein